MQMANGRNVLTELLSERDESVFYQKLDGAGYLRHNYGDYMSTAPINVDSELKNVSKSDFDRCCALLTMLLREDHFSNGSFMQRLEKGDVQAILKRMIDLSNFEQPQIYKEPLMLNSLLRLEELEKTKIRFNQFNGEKDPMDEYLSNPDLVNNQWLFWRSKQRMFSAGETAICLLKIGNDAWLLTTIKKVVKELGAENAVNYEGEEIESYQPYFGRLIIRFHKNFQATVRYIVDLLDQLEVLQFLPTTFDGVSFPGYDKVRLSYDELRIILSRQKRDWLAALENQKAVYLIRDSSNGKLYVGSATGENGMLLQRWTSYVQNGHGGNKELIAIVEREGFDYVKCNFVYSILEN